MLRVLKNIYICGGLKKSKNTLFMEKIDNKGITLLGFIDPYINYTTNLRIITEFTSKWAIEWLLIRLPEESEISVITSNLTPDIYNTIDSIYCGRSNTKLIETALNENKLKIGINLDIKTKIWLLYLNSQSYKQLAINGNSNLTEQGLWRKTGELNYWSFDEKDFEQHELEWEKIRSETQWISLNTWSAINSSDSLFKLNFNFKSLPKLESILYNTKKLNITIFRIQEIVSNYFKINIRELIDKSRDSKLVLARQIAMFFSNEFTDNTITKIGSEFNRDHATVLYAKSKINKLINSNPSYNKMIVNIRNLIINEIHSNEI
jgi:hypothetical protein